MKKCDCYVEVSGFNPDPYSSLFITQSRCNGTRERDECTCGGDPAKCDFYPEKREAAQEEEIMKHIEYLTSMLYSCLGVPQLIMETNIKPGAIYYGHHRIYYAHHQWKYGTKIEEYELNLIKLHFPNAVIFNPATDLKFKDCGDEEIIMDECLNKVLESNIVIFSAMDGMIGIGVYNEVMAAKEAGKLVLCLTSNKLYSTFSIYESPECGSDRLYARACVPMFD